MPVGWASTSPSAPVLSQSAGRSEQSLLDFDSLGVAAIHFDADGVVRAANGTWQRNSAGGGLFTALQPGRELRTAAAALGIPVDLLTGLITSARSSLAEPFDLRVGGPAGSAGWLYRLRAGGLSHSNGGTILTCVDVTLPLEAEQRLRYESAHDRLTGLAHRDPLLSEIASVLDGDGGRRHLVLYVDLDGFKQVNDAHGPGVGDALLVEVARRLTGTRPDDTGRDGAGSVGPRTDGIGATGPGSDDMVARLGGDEFAVLTRGVPDARAALDRAQRLHALLTGPYDVAGRRILLTASVGCRITGLQAGETAESVLGDADEAMYQAKKAGKDGVAMYSAELHERAVRRSEIEWALGEALGTDQLRLVYQPQVCLETGRLVAVEALLRWTSPELGEVSPAEFVPVAEGSRLILPLGDWVLNEACRQLAEWRFAGPAPATVAVNVSPVQLCAAGFAESVAAALDAHGVEAHRLCLEITETALMDSSAAVAATLRALHGLGIYLAIDDFGTGHSSLAQLRELPVELLKIDQSFIVGVDVDSETAGIVTAVLNLAHVLGMYVVAEGVETDGHARELILRGCHVGQGLRFSPGVPPAEIPRLAAGPFRLAAERRESGHRRSGSRSTARPGPAGAGQVRGTAEVPRWATGRGCRLMLAELMYQLGLPEEDR
jgi:predicted signal transduction protein with EAL and GGDEF domain